MIPNLLLFPPVALVILLIFAWLYYTFLRTMTPRGLPRGEGQAKPYACGEEQTNPIRADYAQFFPFAFFFTILHVVALTVTTVPVVELGGNFVMAILYIACALVGLSVLYRRYA